MAINDFEDVFDYIGGFGPYQWIIFGFLCLFNCFYSVVFYGQIFMVVTPPHWCKLPPSVESSILQKFGSNLTMEQLKNLTIPVLPGGDYESCKRYDFDIEMLSSININTENWTNMSTTSCDYGWEYDYSYYYPTITSELNWVCSDDWKPTLAQIVFFIGCVFGLPLFGWMADHFGRIPIIVLSNCIGGIFGVASSFSNSFLVFCILRFVVGMTFDSHFVSIYTLGLEFVSSRYRSIVANVPMVLCLSTVKAGLPWLALYVHHWTTFGVIVYAPMLIAVIVPFVLPESARWLIGKGDINKMILVIEKVGKFNGRKLSLNFIDDLKNFATQEKSQQTKEVVTWYDLLKTPNLRKRFLALCFIWSSIVMVFDGLVRNTANIGNDFFVTFSTFSAVEIPAGIFAIFSIEWLGRKNTTILTLIICGVISMITIGISQENILTIVGMGVVSRFLMTITINIGTQYVMEILPTVGRVQGAAAIHAVGFLTLFVSPYSVYLSKIKIWIPYAVLGTLSLLGGFTALLIPETLGENLPDSLDDGEKFFTDQPLLYNPLKKRKNKFIGAKSRENPSVINDTKL